MLTFGFYDSLNHDRRYTAIQMSSIFDGIIEDGIFATIGDRFMVQGGLGMRLSVGTGRAWFNHTWTLNDSKYYLDVRMPEIATTRIDAVVLEINSHPDIRANSIRIIEGTSKEPDMTHNEYVHQYPLAYITVPPNATAITQANIRNVVGMNETPYVIGAAQPSFSIEDIILSFESEWDKWLWGYTNQCTNEYATWKEAFDAQFHEWFAQLNAILDENVAANLANEITKLTERIRDYEDFRSDLLHHQAIYSPLEDSNGNPILDSEGDNVIGRIVFAIR